MLMMLMPTTMVMMMMMPRECSPSAVRLKPFGSTVHHWLFYSRHLGFRVSMVSASPWFARQHGFRVTLVSQQKLRRKREQVLHSLKEGYDDDDGDDDAYGDESIMIVNS